MNYNSFYYLYPPRPEVKIPSNDLEVFETGEYIAQPKYNGSACMVFTNGSDLHVYNRHRQPLTNVSPAIDFKRLSVTGKWFVYAGEYLNKSKTGETGIKEKDKFVIWDILVCNGKTLVGETMLNRLMLLEQMYPSSRGIVDKDGKMQGVYEHLCITRMEGIYKAPTYEGYFFPLYNDLVKTDLYEGLVLKKKQSKLKFGLQEKNNTEWQVKCRKETKIYKF